MLLRKTCCNTPAPPEATPRRSMDSPSRGSELRPRGYTCTITNKGPVPGQSYPPPSRPPFHSPSAQEQNNSFNESLEGKIPSTHDIHGQFDLQRKDSFSDLSQGRDSNTSDRAYRASFGAARRNVKSKRRSTRNLPKANSKPKRGKSARDCRWLALPVDGKRYDTLVKSQLASTVCDHGYRVSTRLPQEKRHQEPTVWLCWTSALREWRKESSRSFQRKNRRQCQGL